MQNGRKGIEQAEARETTTASVTRRAENSEGATARGRFEAWCTGPDGKEKWRDVIENVVCTEGKNLMLDAALAGSAYTTTGPFMGLISAANFTAVAATDRGSQINGTNGWTEAGNAHQPTYIGNRPTCTWTAATNGTKVLANPLAFTFSGSGSAKGCFILYGTGANNVMDTAAGILWSAGLFSTGDKLIGSGDVLNVAYNTSL